MLIAFFVLTFFIWTIFTRVTLASVGY